MTANNMTAQEVVSTLDLKPLEPEGGFFREFYRSKTRLPAGTLPTVNGARDAATDAYYLLSDGAVSYLHRLKADELWHFHLGTPTTLVELRDGGAKCTTIGPDLKNGHRLHHVVPAGTWFGAYCDDPQAWSLLGMTVVAPGFEFEDFELGDRRALQESFPDAADLVARLTPHPEG